MMQQITLAAELESLSRFRDFMDKIYTANPQIGEDAIYDLKLAIDEACSNVIIHGYAGMNPGSIILACEAFPGRVLVTITDFGHPFEPSEPSAPDIEAVLEDRPSGGFGLFFIYQTMDEISYQTTEDGNCLTFIKRTPT